MAVANWFLKRSWQESNLPPCDQMKLYKLVFYAHGWYMGNRRVELIPEDVEAWPHGPVIRDLYLEFNDFGAYPINRLGERIEIVDDEVSFVTPEHDGTLNNYFDSIWNVYGKFTGIQLSNMTHRPDEPWTIVAKHYKYRLSGKPIIPSEIIQSSFEQKIKKYKSGR
ncbi:MAG: DUF4065 domain-containing protein [Gammaproteobacteria bacterium]|nr:DUF4065 domain-containing protein [Gammaproteobacteria bacterium]